jgi:ATP-dependent RNA helicase DeaD
MKEFEKLGINIELINAIEALGFKTPMPIQKEVIPLMLNSNENIIGLAQTGTGKTAAFGLPILQTLDLGQISKPQVLILSPTRELCLQISNDLKAFAKFMDKIHIVSVYGGASIDKQIKDLKKAVHIIVATPGRMLDILNRQVTSLNSISTLVLDEADEMLNMGFKEELDQILQKTPIAKRTLLFSATMPAEIRHIASTYISHAKEITIGRKNVGAENVEHFYYYVQARDRYLALKRIADYYPDIYSIVFCRTRVETAEVADKLMNDGYNADALHGDLSQAQRDLVMQKFRQKTLQMLVATDVAARGLDVNDLTHVINYNLPDDNIVYTHRSGRTGRANKKGIAISIVNLKEKSRIKQLEKVISKPIIEMPVPNGPQICEKQLFSLIEKVEKINVNDSEIEKYLPVIFERLQCFESEELIKRFVSVEFNRFLDYYKDAVDINVRKNDFRADDNMSRFFINIGKMDGLDPKKMIGMINDLTGKRHIPIGKIDIMKSFSFFEVDEEYQELIVDKLNQETFNQRQIRVEVAGFKTDKGHSSRSKRPFSKPDRQDFDKKPKKTKFYEKPFRAKQEGKKNFSAKPGTKKKKPAFSQRATE